MFVALFVLAGKKSIDSLKAIQWVPFLGAILCTVIITVSISFRWKEITNHLEGKKVASWTSFYYFFIISRALGFIIPKDISDIGLRTAGLKKRHNLRTMSAGTSVIIDRLFDLLLIGLFLLGTLPFWSGLFSSTLNIIFLLFFLAIPGIILIFNHRILVWILQKIIDLLFFLMSVFPFLRKKMPEKIVFPELTRNIATRLYLLSLLKITATAGRFVFFSHALGLIIDPNTIIYGTPLAQLSYLIAFTPGGLGIFEAGWLGVLKLGQINTSSALSFAVGQRILTMIIITGLGLIAQMVYATHHLIRKRQK